jgi:hypothetical protein
VRKTIVLISLSIAYVSIVRLVFPNTPFQVLGLNAPIAWIGFSVSSLGILFEWDWLQQLNLKVFFHTMSLLLLALTVLSIMSPTYAGHLTSYVHFADNFVTLESAIVLWLLGSEQRVMTFPLMLYIGFTSELLLRNFSHRLTPSHELRHIHVHFR